MARFSVRFLGCKVSQADAVLIRDRLLDAGHVEVAPEQAEVRVINTCALTVEAERKSRQQANRAARAAARTFVTGCAVNLNAGQFDADGVVAVGRSAERAAAEIVALLGPAAPLGCQDEARPAGRTRAFLKVQNGCDSACSFCIIPTTRGRAESRPLAAVLSDARRRLAEGHPELVLTGINIGTYRDAAAGADLADLIRAVAALEGEGLMRLRVSSIEPGDVGGRLLEAMAETAVAAPHLHVPLQSADPGVLEAMRRSYTVERFLAACAAARRALPGLNLTTDAIVAFPGEDEAAFARTLAAVAEAGMSKVHVFPYSPRPGTAAAGLADQVGAEERRERARRLRDLSDLLGDAHRRGRVGSADAVLLETRLDGGEPVGLGADYTRFVLPPDAGAPGEMVPVVAEAVAGDYLRGRLRGDR
jgi:threonylcarbamoyladenosine tRNA methylthiotransferase MtaB